MKNSIGVVILNHHTYSELKKALYSVFRSKIPKDWILRVNIVDSESNPKKLKRIQKQFPRVEYLSQRENVGCGMGYNIGIAHFLHTPAAKRPKYIFFMNADVILEFTTLEILIERMEREQNLGLLTPKMLLPTSPARIYFVQGIIDRHRFTGGHTGWNQIDRGQFDKIRETDFVNMAAALGRVSALEKIGFFDPNYFLYYEDTDLSIRTRNKGYALAIETSAIAWHKASASMQINSLQIKEYYLARNHLLFLRRHRPLLWNFRAYVGIFKETFLRLIHRRVNKLFLYGIYDGFRGKGGRRDFTL